MKTTVRLSLDAATTLRVISHSLGISQNEALNLGVLALESQLQKRRSNREATRRYRQRLRSVSQSFN
jgi:hypothetical protein